MRLRPGPIMAPNVYALCGVRHESGCAKSSRPAAVFLALRQAGADAAPLSVFGKHPSIRFKALT